MLKVLCRRVSTYTTGSDVGARGAVGVEMQIGTPTGTARPETQRTADATVDGLRLSSGLRDDGKLLSIGSFILLLRI